MLKGVDVNMHINYQKILKVLTGDGHSSFVCLVCYEKRNTSGPITKPCRYFFKKKGPSRGVVVGPNNNPPISTTMVSGTGAKEAPPRPREVNINKLGDRTKPGYSKSACFRSSDAAPDPETALQD